MRKKAFLIVALVLVVCGASYYLLAQSNDAQDDQSMVSSEPTVSFGENVFEVEIAQTSAERELGLGNRKSIADATGMLFVFPQSDRHSIWMRNMLFPLDIIWLNPVATGESALTVVDMRTEVLPSTYPEAFLPKTAVLYVLELPAGSAEKAGFGIGSVLTFRK